MFGTRPSSSSWTSPPRAEAQRPSRISDAPISPIIIDYSGTRAWGQIDDEWRGATFLLEKKDGVWIAEKIDSWVS